MRLTPETQKSRPAEAEREVGLGTVVLLGQASPEPAPARVAPQIRLAPQELLHRIHLFLCRGLDDAALDRGWVFQGGADAGIGR